MTNLQEAANPRQQLLQQRLLLGLPIALGSLVAVAITGALTLPQWLRLQANSAKLEQLQELQQRIPLLRAQLDRTRTDQQQAERKKAQVLQLIEGSGEFVTFLAQLDREATRNGLQLELFEPVVVAPPPPEPPKGGNQNKQQAPASPPKAPLEQAGLSAQRVLLTARGRFPNLLAFMRSVERLSLLVVPSDFSLQSISAGAGAPNAQTFDSEMKLALTYYQAPDSGLKPAAEAKPSKPPKTNPAS